MLHRVIIVYSRRSNLIRVTYRQTGRVCRFNFNFKVRVTNQLINRCRLQAYRRDTNSTGTLLLATERLNQVVIRTFTGTSPLRRNAHSHLTFALQRTSRRR